MPVEYFETHFRTESHVPRWPAHFAIITAFATTGHQWSAQEIGCEFRQHALYFVQDDSLFIVACEGPEILYPAGRFRARHLVV